MTDNDSCKPPENQIDNEDTARVVQIADELQRIKNDEESETEWDGSEAEFVEDEDAEEYEIPMAGIKISYALTKEEYYKCLSHSNLYKTQGKRAIIQTVLLSIIAVLFLISYFVGKNPLNIAFCVISLLLIACIVVVPHFHLKSMANKMADGKIIEAEIYPDCIEIGRDDGAWKIELDGTSHIAEFDNIIMIFTKENQGFAIPERAIEPEIFPEIKAILLAGTNPQPSDDE